MRILNVNYCLHVITRKIGLHKYLISLCVISLLSFIRTKYLIAQEALLYVNTYADEVDTARLDHDRTLFGILENSTTPPAILFANQFALNITLNWLCNVRSFDLVERLVFIALDDVTKIAILRVWPQVTVIRWTIPSMEGRFNIGSGAYQMFQLFRANMISYLTKSGKDFWMFQADTYWRTNLFEMLDQFDLRGDVLFDKEGTTGLSKEMIAGGNFFVRSNKKTSGFFQELSYRLRYIYATDNNIMGSLCASRYHEADCGEIPFQVIANWRWHLGPRREVPHLLQFDDLGAGKYERLLRLKARFASSNGSCLESSRRPERAVTLEALRRYQLTQSIPFRLVVWSQSACELLYRISPYLGHHLRTIVIPHFAYYLVV